MSGLHPSTGSLEASDKAAGAVQQTPNRVTLADLEANIGMEWTFNAGEACEKYHAPHGTPGVGSLAILTVCVIVTKNGFTLIGKSAPADANNFNPELGAKLAREDAIRQLWPLMGYALREKLAGA